MTERAAIGDGAGGHAVAAIEVGDPGPGEVRVRLRASGLCHTDVKAMSWGRPVVLGHEGAGVVEAIGSGVDGLRVGDRVALNWAIPCGACAACRRGHRNLCEQNNMVTASDRSRGHAHPAATRRDGVPLERAFQLGTLSTATVVRAAACVPMPADLPWAAACLIGCGVMTGVGSVLEAARVAPGSTAVVLGCGGVGLNVVQGCRVAGAVRIVAVDLHAARLADARRFGATDTFRADAADVELRAAALAVRELLGGGADYAFECTSVPRLCLAPLAFVRNGGTALQLSGTEQRLEVDMELFEWDKTYLNPLYGKCDPERDFARIFDLWRRGELLLDELVTATYALDEVGAAFVDMLAGRLAKGVVLLGE